MAYNTGYAEPQAVNEKPSRLELIDKQIMTAASMAQDLERVIRQLADKLIGPRPESVGVDGSKPAGAGAIGGLERGTDLLHFNLESALKQFDRLSSL